jgi:cullin-associated NEDD8-dissociated protein 1
LKILVSKIPAETALAPIIKALNVLVQVCVPKVEEEIKMEALDVLTDILGRFGGFLSNKHKELQTAFIGELSSTSSSLRKRAISCLAALSIHLNEDLFKSLFQFVLKQIDNDKTGENLGTYIQLCSSILKSSGYRVGKYLKEVVPLLVKVANIVAENDEIDANEQSQHLKRMDDVRENIMLGQRKLIFNTTSSICFFYGKDT